MKDALQCGERKDGARCLRPLGHHDVHRAVSRGGLIMWGVDSEPEKTPHEMWKEGLLATLTTWADRLLGTWEDQFAPQEPAGASESPVQDAPAAAAHLRGRGPHSKACGIHQHLHGARCHHTCPTCGGKGPEPVDAEIDRLCAEVYRLEVEVIRLRRTRQVALDRLQRVWQIVYATDDRPLVHQHDGYGYEVACLACWVLTLREALQ